MQNVAESPKRDIELLSNEAHQCLRDTARGFLSAARDHIDPTGAYRGLDEASRDEGDLPARLQDLHDLVSAWHTAARLRMVIDPRITGAVRRAMGWLAVQSDEIQVPVHREFLHEGILWFEIPGAIRG